MHVSTCTRTHGSPLLPRPYLRFVPRLSQQHRHHCPLALPPPSRGPPLPIVTVTTAATTTADPSTTASRPSPSVVCGANNRSTGVVIFVAQYLPLHPKFGLQNTIWIIKTVLK
uniref:Uncharacterized protein n=1 Tax=Trypanosoma congolense (strain IL3000) TaxID=1068625 RepID=G0URR7_TRYCI|nr:hypothetical protein, unlikely [Trypanosoma congolense IL3000]